MKKFKVEVNYVASINFEIEAEDEELALEAAKNEEEGLPDDIIFEEVVIDCFIIKEIKE